MLKCNLGKKWGKRILKVKFHGTIDELASDAAFIIGKIYREMNKQNLLSAEYFKDIIKTVVNDPESPIWEDK